MRDEVEAGQRLVEVGEGVWAAMYARAFADTFVQSGWSVTDVEVTTGAVALGDGEAHALRQVVRVRNFDYVRKSSV